MSNGTMLNPDGDRPRLAYRRLSERGQPEDLPDLAPGEIRVVTPDNSPWRSLTPPSITRVAPGELIPEPVLSRLWRRNKRNILAVIERAVRESNRWELEARA